MGATGAEYRFMYEVGRMMAGKVIWACEKQLDEKIRLLF